MKYEGKIIQVLPTLSYGDGVGNDTLAIDDLLKRSGIKTCIYAENIDKRISRNLVKSVSEMPQLTQRDIVIYHYSTGSSLNGQLQSWPARKIMIYHNITPYQFFDGYSRISRSLCYEGRKTLAEIKNVPDYCLADSEYNKKELIDMGYACEIDVLPIILPLQDYQKKPSEKILKKYAEDGYTNIIFTGRIAPNKKQEDIVETFYYYQKYYNPKSRLFLVGSYQGMEVYFEKLKKFMRELEVHNVVFTGHIAFDEILAYYALADLFLCLSEHEGFCIPLVEAMLFDLPIIAYRSTGVTGTMGEGGFLVQDKNPLEIAGLIHYVESHPEVRQELIRRERLQRERFETELVERQFMGYLEKFIDRK